MKNSAVSIATKTTSAPPPAPPQKGDCYRSFEEFEKKVTKLHLPENWQINSSSNYYRILKNDTIHDIPIFDIYILETIYNLLFVCSQCAYQLTMKFIQNLVNQ